MPGLHIALIHADAWPQRRWGEERLVQDLATYLRDAGNDVDVLSATRGESQFHITRTGRNYRFRIPRMRAVGAIGLTRNEILALRALPVLLLHRYDVVHAFTPPAALAASAAGQPTVLNLIGDPTLDRVPERWMQREVLGRAIVWATEIAAVSWSENASNEANDGRQPVFLPIAISVADIEPNLQARSGAPVILFSGDLTGANSGLPALFAAFRRLLGRHPGARLALDGTGAVNRALEAMAPERHLVRRSIDLIGRSSADFEDRMRSAHVTVLGAAGDAGNLALGSLAVGTPVVGTLPGSGEGIVDDPGVGRLVPSGNVDALFDAIDACIDLSGDPATPRRCRAHADRWDYSRVGPAYERLYASVAGRRGTLGAPLWEIARGAMGALKERMWAPS